MFSRQHLPLRRGRSLRGRGGRKGPVDQGGAVASPSPDRGQHYCVRLACRNWYIYYVTLKLTLTLRNVLPSTPPPPSRPEPLRPWWPQRPPWRRPPLATAHTLALEASTLTVAGAAAPAIAVAVVAVLAGQDGDRVRPRCRRPPP